MGRALVYHGPGELRFESRELPAAKPGEVILDVEACGICGTDLKILRGEHRAFPEGTVRIPGHELVGRVNAVGEGVSVVKPSGRVVVAPNLPCGECPTCLMGRSNLCERFQAIGITLDGGFADQVRIPAAAVRSGVLLPAPEQEDAAVLSLTEPLAAVLRGQRAVDLAADETLLVSGAGPIGLLHIVAARAHARVKQVIVSEPCQSRRDRALEAGADLAVDPSERDLAEAVREATDGYGVDAAIVAVPVGAAVRGALAATGIGGRINVFGGMPRDQAMVELDLNEIHYRELLVTGTTANTTEDCREALELLLSGGIAAADLISARYPLDRFDDAFTHAARGDAAKVVIMPTQQKREQ